MIVERVLEAKQRKIKQYPVRANRASQLGHPCLKYLVLLRTRWQEETLHDARVQMIFDMGNAVEEIVFQDLKEAGFVIVEQQRPFAWDKFQITGKVDFKLALALAELQTDRVPPEVLAALIEEANEGKVVVPTEVKSMAPSIFASINSVGDMLRHKYVYLRKYPPQLTVYLIMDGKRVGLFLLKKKSTGEMKELWMLLDYDYAEEQIHKAELINKHVAEGTLPEPIEYSEDICGSCGFQHICLPERIGKEVEILDDAHLVELLTQYDQLKPQAKAFDQVDAELKTLLNGKEKLLIGDWFITGKWIDKTSYELPDEIKEQYKVVSRYWKRQIIPAKKD